MGLGRFREWAKGRWRRREGAQVADLPELPSTERRLASIGLKEILAGET